MDANEFVTKLKATNTVTDLCDLAKVFNDYKDILSQIATKDRAPFSLNVLCVLCRNLDKAPKWRDSIDNKELLTLSVECARETRAMERADRVKTLACLYHIHRHVVKQNSPVPPELALKISYMPFEVDSKHLLNEYSKTYWNILVDRLTYIERLRHKIAIVKLLPKLTEDFIKIIDIYETVQFCNNILVFLVKKMHLLYNEKHAKELNQTFAQIFQKLSMKDMKPFKALAHKELLEVYVKLNECMYIIAENASKTNFKDSPLENIVRTCLSIVGHSSDLFHCLQTFYSNSFCSLLTVNTHLNYSVTVLNGLVVSFEMAEKLGYSKAMLATYPFLNQFLRLYIEFNVNNCNKKQWKDNFNMQIQEPCLKLIQILIERLKYCDQLLRCENCDLKSGLHDSLRLSFLVKHFITVSLCQNIDISDILPFVLEIIDNQYKMLTELKDLGCVNYEKCFRKLQTDIHNTAISLNKAQYYEYSIKLFDVYLKYEIKQLTEQKNISRALYNKSICELDSKLYKSALIDAFLSLVFSDGLSSEKYMSLVMDIKAKELKSKTDDDDETKSEELQLLSLIDACKIALDSKMYGDIKQFLRNIKFCELLKHEFAMYAKLWPSVTPIAGVWRSLHDLAKGKYGVTVDEEVIWTLYEIVLETPSVVRAVSDEHFKQVIIELIEELDGKILSTDYKVVYASLLLLKTEFDLAAASQKYGWKTTEPLQNLDPDQIPANRTISQEYAASKSAIHAVKILSELSHDFDTVSLSKCLEHSLQIYQVYVQQLLQLARDVEGLQLAYICCLIADFIGNDEAYVTNAGILLYHGTKCEELDHILKLAGEKCKGVTEETSILLMCDASMYYSRCGSFGPAAKFAEFALARILSAYEMDPEINLDLAIGRLLEALVQLCLDSGPSTLSAANGMQRHYLSIANTGTKWHTRRHRSLTLVLHTCISSIVACVACAGLGLRRRARAAASAALPRASAAHRAKLYVLITDESAFDDAQIKIDNRLKHVLGLQPSNETQPYYAATEAKKQEPFTPKQEIETMLDNMFFKKSQISPSIPCTSVPAFKIPDFFSHSSKCDCYACNMPVCYVLACHTNGLEASMYFRANENEIARNYFNGILKMFIYIEDSFKSVKKRYLDVYTDFVVESVMKNYWERFRRVKIGILIELSFFELKCNDSDVADEHIVEIHEILQELGTVNQYMVNDVMNLMTCSAQMRKIIKKHDDIESLELDFDSLKLTPVKYTEPPKTPVTKLSKPPTVPKVIVKDEELPKKRKVIKLNLDDGSSDEKDPKAVSRKHEFKIPVPVTKHVLEAATPRNSKPKILVTQPSQETPNAALEFYTPKDKTPEQFFTPMTSVKTYKSLRRNIVKNLEQEFSTPVQSNIEKKTDIEKENTKANLELPSRSRKKVVKSILKRATSPGKLCKEKELPRNRRLRKPVNYGTDDDDKR